MSGTGIVAFAIAALAAANLIVGLKFGVSAIHGSSVSRSENPMLFGVAMGISASCGIIAFSVGMLDSFTAAEPARQSEKQATGIEQHFVMKPPQ